jgi:hypothetical protein
MHEGLARIAVATALAFASGSACAMTAADPRVQCHVINGGKLSKASGGSDALCHAVQSAIGKQVQAQKYSVEITVLGPSRISVQVTSGDGRKIVEQKYGSMDRELTGTSFERFANSLAAELVEADGKNS